MKRVYTVGTLPAPLQSEMNTLLASLRRKYGDNALAMGVHIENLSTLVGMVQAAPVMSAEDHANAIKMTAAVCGDIIAALGTATGTDEDAAYAVARALRDNSNHIEQELHGEKIPPAVADAAVAALAKARAA